MSGVRTSALFSGRKPPDEPQQLKLHFMTGPKGETAGVQAYLLLGLNQADSFCN